MYVEAVVLAHTQHYQMYVDGKYLGLSHSPDVRGRFHDMKLIVLS
jgi:hypothetical protein